MKIVKSKIVPVGRKDVDTDLIIPAEFLTVTTRDGLGEHLFARVRDELELERFKGREILVAGANFGCGSSREHAAWALADWGVKVVIAPSFADIFYNNALKNGILPVAIDGEFFDVEGEVEVDLERQVVVIAGHEYDFEIDPYRRECLMKGMEDMDYLLANMEAIKDFDKKHCAHIFFDTSKL